MAPKTPRKTFFATYQTLEDDAVELKGWHGVDPAPKFIDECRDRAQG